VTCRIWFVRHGRPEPIDGRKRCISRTDLPLSDEGRRQAAEAGDYLSDKGITAVYASPLTRCRDTASAIAGRLNLTVTLVDDLSEVAAGEWEGLPFDEIRLHWPELYDRRGEHIGTVAPPGGESFIDAGKRLDRAFADILAQSRGDIAVVTHGGILRGWLCPLLGVDPDQALTVRQPWGGITEVAWDGAFHVVSHGIRPGLPSEADIKRLYHKFNTPLPVIEHCHAVAKRAEQLSAGRAYAPILRAAALLHDLCRTEGRDHPAAVASVLDAEGWPQLADIVSRHHDLGENPSAEAELLALADRLTEGTRAVTLEQRFEAARLKCQSSEALTQWQRRYDEALRLYHKYC